MIGSSDKLDFFKKKVLRTISLKLSWEHIFVIRKQYKYDRTEFRTKEIESLVEGASLFIGLKSFLGSNDCFLVHSHQNGEGEVFSSSEVGLDLISKFSFREFQVILGFSISGQAGQETIVSNVEELKNVSMMIKGRKNSEKI